MKGQYHWTHKSTDTIRYSLYSFNRFQTNALNLNLVQCIIFMVILVHLMAWCRKDDETLLEQMISSFCDATQYTRSQWVNVLQGAKELVKCRMYPIHNLYNGNECLYFHQWVSLHQILTHKIGPYIGDECQWKIVKVMNFILLLKWRDSFVANYLHIELIIV